MRRKNPRFRRSLDYYYDQYNDIIYGREKHTFLYFHELSHHIDHIRPKYREVSFMFNVFGQLLVYFFVIACIIAFMSFNEKDWLHIWAIFLFLYGIYASFILSEEIRAYVNGFIWWRRWKKRYKR